MHDEIPLYGRDREMHSAVMYVMGPEVTMFNKLEVQKQVEDEGEVVMFKPGCVMGLEGRC